MRPTKEMILETKGLMSRTRKDIRQIIKKNDMELKSIRKKDKKTWGRNSRFLFWMLFVISLIIFYQAYRFFIS